MAPGEKRKLTNCLSFNHGTELKPNFLHKLSLKCHYLEVGMVASKLKNFFPLAII